MKAKSKVTKKHIVTRKNSSRTSNKPWASEPSIVNGDLESIHENSLESSDDNSCSSYVETPREKHALPYVGSLPSIEEEDSYSEVDQDKS